MRTLDQKTRDRQRKTYRLSFPNELDAESVTAWIRSISGTLRPTRGRLGAVPTVAFEMYATQAGIQHRMKVPWQHADYVVAQLRSLVPGIRVTPEEEFPTETWTSGVEVALTHSSRQLRIYNSSNTATSLLAAVQALEKDEAMLMQWVVTPAVPTAPPTYQNARTHQTGMRALLVGLEPTRDEITDRRAKLEQPNVQAVLRVAAKANTEVRAQHLIYRVRASLASTRGPSTRFTKRLVGKQRLQKRIDHTSAPAIFPIQLSAPELASLIAWPIGNPFVSGLPTPLSRQLPAPDSVPNQGRIIGRSNFPGNERPIAVSHRDALKHLHVAGPTGVGKTALLSNMLRQDIDQGYGVILIEAKGDLFEQALEHIPYERMNDVVVLDINDRKHPVGFNVLSQGDPRIVVDEIGALFDHLYKETRSVWTRELLYHGLQTLISTPGLTFVDLAPLMVPMTAEEEQWSDHVRRNVRDRDLKLFWQRFETQPKARQDQITAPLLDRIWQLNARPEVRNIIGQSESGFTMQDVIANNKILLINLANLPTDTATLTGTLLINALWHAVKTTPNDTPNFLYLDEFQSFLNLPMDAEDMLAKARSFGLGMTLAHQHLGQLPPDLKQAVSANARTKIVFQTSSEDAKAMARDFGSAVDEHDFMHLGRFEALARIATGDGVSQPLSLTTLEPIKGYNHGKQVINRSRAAHSRLVSDVEQSIIQRRTPEQAPRTKRPDIGSPGSSWGQ